MKNPVKLPTKGTGLTDSTRSITVTYAPTTTILPANAAIITDVTASGFCRYVLAVKSHEPAATVRGNRMDDRKADAHVAECRLSTSAKRVVNDTCLISVDGRPRAEVETAIRVLCLHLRMEPSRSR